MIVVTGMHRSGTSCVTGLLEKCGYRLGESHSLLNDPRFDNPKGHFENLGALTINDAILKCAGGSWYAPPPASAVSEAGTRLSHHIKKFSETFNGDIFKDPRTCLTISEWEKYCHNMDAVVFCLRNPVGVASSLKRRNNFSIAQGLYLWYEYNVRFFKAFNKVQVIIVDYDNMRSNLELENLCKALGLSLSAEEIFIRTRGFYEEHLNHDISNEHLLSRLPEEIKKLYSLLKSQTFSQRLFKNTTAH